MFRFAEGIWLAALALVPIAAVLFALSASARRRALEAFAEPALARRLTDTVSAAARRWKVVLLLASLAVLVYYVQSGQTHRRLQPWCPECGNQGGTDKVETPEPMPMGGLGA